MKKYDLVKKWRRRDGKKTEEQILFGREPTRLKSLFVDYFLASSSKKKNFEAYEKCSDFQRGIKIIQYNTNYKSNK